MKLVLDKDAVLDIPAKEKSAHRRGRRFSLAACAAGSGGMNQIPMALRPQGIS